MSPADARRILGLLGPLDTTAWCIAVKKGRVAVIILEDPANVARDEFELACLLHDRLGSGLLIVL